MSAYELPIDHLAALVNIGHQLDIRNVYSEHSNLTQRLALDDEGDRTYLLTELVCQMTTSVAYRYSEKAPLISEVPSVKLTRIPLETIADLAQALHWVRCYQYQSCEDPKWRTTFAHRHQHAPARTDHQDHQCTYHQLDLQRTSPHLNTQLQRRRLNSRVDGNTTATRQVTSDATSGLRGSSCQWASTDR